MELQPWENISDRKKRIPFFLEDWLPPGSNGSSEEGYRFNAV